MRADSKHRGTKAVGVALSALLLVLLVGSRPQADPPEVLSFVELELEHPTSVRAGETFSLTIRNVTSDRIVSVTFDAGYGPRTFSTASEDGQAVLTIPPDSYSGAGLVVVDASAGNQRAVSTMKVLPGEAAPPLDLFLGPRTVEVGTGDVSMLVAVPTDALGNPVADDTLVSYLHTQPSGDVSKLFAPTSGLLSYIDVPSGTRTGRSVISATAGDAQGPERTFSEVAALATDFALHIDGPIPVANGRDLLMISSSDISDRFGNPLPDGTIGHLEIDGVTGRRRIASSSIDSRLTFVVEAPALPGTANLLAFASGGKSRELAIDFDPAVVEIPIDIEEQSGTSVIVVGPVLEPDGAFVPDGTPASIVVDGNSYDVEIELGFVSITTPTANSVEVQVLGVSAKSPVSAR